MSDLISRQAAIDAVNDVIADYIPNLYGRYEALPLEIASAVNRLPSAQPTVDAVPVIRCKDCKWYYRGGATCMYWDGENGVRGDDYCSRAERQKDDRR